jgi:2-keto-3-deoxy-L-rhamnonate aldolase RhmA
MLAASAQYQWLFLDIEHGPMSVETAAELSVMALASGVTPLARLSSGDHSLAARLLDAGAWGVLMSHVETAEEAATMVRRLRFPPEGERSVSYSLPQLRFAPMGGGAAARHFNEQMLLVAMIESSAAAGRASEIAAVPGIDALFVGANDLTTDLGVPGEFGHAGVAEACRCVVDACAAHGKWPGVGGIYEEALLTPHLEAGMRLVLGGTDMALTSSALHRRMEMLRRAEPPR